MMVVNLSGSVFLICSGSWLLFWRDRGLGGFFLAVGILATAKTLWMMFMRGAA